MFDVTINVTYTDGRIVPVRVRPIDSVKFEEKFDIAISEAFSRGKELRVTHLYFLAHSASDTTLGFEDWVRSLQTIEVGDAADAVPFDPAKPTGS